MNYIFSDNILTFTILDRIVYIYSTLNHKTKKIKNFLKTHKKHFCKDDN